MELIEARVAVVATFIEAKLAERAIVKTFEVHRPDGTTINVGRTHRQFEEVLSWVDAGCYPFLIGPAGSIDVPLDQRGDIYIDAADTTAAEVWLDPAKAQRWVLGQLKTQGITMRAA